jgi:small-conductance mechanosensitive channel
VTYKFRRGLIASLLSIVLVTAMAVSMMIMSGGGAAAQQTPIDYTNWEPVAERAEEATNAARASDTALEALRQELVDWRERFQAARDQNTASITAVKAQLEALGPTPAEGEEEPDEIASQRKSLNDRLATLQAPGKAAEVAYSRADALIGEIDRILRERQADQLL